MWNKIILTSFFLCCLFFSSCSQKINCEQLANQFLTYQEAGRKIKSASFKISEKANTTKSSWINSASYYSCDGNTGYFIFVAKEKEYIHFGVPYSVWQGFKNAESYGRFYNKKIKYQYKLLLKH